MKHIDENTVLVVSTSLDHDKKEIFKSLNNDEILINSINEYKKILNNDNIEIFKQEGNILITESGYYLAIYVKDVNEVAEENNKKDNEENTNNLNDVDLIKELTTTFDDLKKQLIKDEERWGNTWKNRGLIYKNQSQEDRWFNKIQNYYHDYLDNGTPMPWDKILGETHITKVREKYCK